MARRSEIDARGLGDDILRLRASKSSREICEWLERHRKAKVSPQTVISWLQRRDSELEERRRSASTERFQKEAAAHLAIAEHVETGVGAHMRRIDKSLQFMEDVIDGKVTDQRMNPKTGKLVDVPVSVAVRQKTAKDLVTSTAAVVSLTKSDLTPETVKQIAGSLEELVGRASREIFGPRAMDRSTSAKVVEVTGDIVDADTPKPKKLPAPPVGDGD